MIIYIYNNNSYDCIISICQKTVKNKARRVGERFNDGKVDPLGCYWAGTLCRDASEEIVPKAAKLYRRYGDGAVKMVMEELSISNGAWDYE